MKTIIYYNNILMLSKEFLDSQSIDANTSKVIFKRKKHCLCKIDGLWFIKYTSIPAPTRAKLPGEIELKALANLNKHQTAVDEYFKHLNYEYSMGYIKHIESFKAKYPTLSQSKIYKAAKLFAVWSWIIENGNKNNFPLYTAFNKIYSGVYKNENSFYNAKSKAVNNGAESLAIDQRWFTTPKNIKKVSELNQFWAAALVGSPRKFSNRQVFDRICILCKEANEKPPANKSWVDKFRKRILEENISVYQSRYGAAAAKAKQLPFATMQSALNANTQWQMDGWRLPFYVENPNPLPNEKRYCNRYDIVIVKDAYSKKIVGYAVGKNEDTITIMSALRNAIINTGVLPSEILTDNHSFNKTKEAANFKEAIAEIGTKYNATSNPQHKSIIERHNRHLDRLCRNHYGYLGEGIKSRSIDGQPSQELLDKYLKNNLSINEIMGIGFKIVEDYNNEILNKEGKTPNELYATSEKPNCYKVDVFDRVKLLTAKTESKISRGQITIKRGGIKFEYQLPASLYSKYNNKTVIVRYEDLKEEIYLYDIKNDAAIIQLQQRTKIHGAKADQTEIDIELLNRNKGRIKGIISKAKQANENLMERALNTNPEAYELLNRITTPKHILKELEQNATLKAAAIDNGVDFNNVYIPVRDYDELNNEDFKPKSKINESPFAPKNHKIRKLLPSEFTDNDD